MPADDLTAQLAEAHRIGRAIGARFDTLTFASMEEVAAGRYPLDNDHDSAAVEAMYQGIREALIARDTAALVAG